jgi:hypothetical protein
LPATPASLAAPDAPLRRLLAAVRREARAWIWIESLALVAVVAAAAAAGLLAIDWLLEPPAWARGVASAAAAGVLVWLLATRLLGRLAAPLADADLARAVERRHPLAGDTLSTAVELQTSARADLDPDLVARTTVAASAIAGTVRPDRVFRRRRLIAVALAGLLATALIVGFAAVFPESAATWGRRMVLLEDVPWPRRVSFEVEGFPGGVRKVARGSDVEILVRAHARGEPPEAVYLRMHDGAAWRSARMGTRGVAGADGRWFAHRLERVTSDTPLEIRGGDGRLRGLRLEVADPPALAAATVRIRLPDYLGGGDRSPAAVRVVPVPAGSAVDLQFTATKPLSAATVTARGGSMRSVDDPERVLATLEPGDPSEASDTITARIHSLDADTHLVISFTDCDGIANREPATMLLTAVPDEPPRLAVQLAGISTAVTPQARVPIVGSISDDHGLAAGGVTLVKDDDRLDIPVPRIGGGQPLVELPVTDPEVVPLAPLGLLPGTRLEVMLTATDGCGLATGPHTTHSDAWSLEVVTADALRAMVEAREILLRRRYEAAIDDVSQARGDSGQAGAGLTARIAEAAARAAGESLEIAAAFRGIRDELANNGLLGPEVETRLVTQIADPVAVIAREPLADLGRAARAAATGDREAVDLASRAEAAERRMREVLARMLELESFNEVVEKLRGLLESQERIRAETIERQRRRAREVLESP